MITTGPAFAAHLGEDIPGMTRRTLGRAFAVHSSARAPSPCVQQARSPHHCLLHPGIISNTSTCPPASSTGARHHPAR